MARHPANGPDFRTMAHMGPALHRLAELGAPTFLILAGWGAARHAAPQRPCREGPQRAFTACACKRGRAEHGQPSASRRADNAGVRNGHAGVVHILDGSAPATQSEALPPTWTSDRRAMPTSGNRDSGAQEHRPWILGAPANQEPPRLHMVALPSRMATVRHPGPVGSKSEVHRSASARHPAFADLPETATASRRKQTADQLRVASRTPR